MAFTPSYELNKYCKLKQQLKFVFADIRFLKMCLENSVYPKFINIRFPIKNHITQRLMQRVKTQWLKSEIDNKYGAVNNINFDCYLLHLKITCNLHLYENELKQRMPGSVYSYEAWLEYDAYMQEVIDYRLGGKRARLHRKFLKLIGEKQANNIPPAVSHLPDFVINESSVTFNNRELELLNYGLKFVPPTSKPPLVDIISDIEAGIKYNVPVDRQQKLRRDVERVIQESLDGQSTSKKPERVQQTIKSLKEKDVFFMKADKGNNIVILDKSDYENRMQDMINDGPYRQHEESIFDTLKELNKKVADAVRDYCAVTGEQPSSLKSTNPHLARLYGLPKVHKTGAARRKMRPICSNVNYPTQKISDYLVKYFSTLKAPNMYSVKNCFEFAQKMNKFKLAPGDVMVSFDVSALFPSVPVEETLLYLEEWLRENNVHPTKIRDLIRLTRLCTDNAFFTYRGKVYQQVSGLAMGSSISPFLAEIYMSRLEKDLSKNELFPKCWFRYVDDVFAIIKKTTLRRFLMKLNNYHPNIKFTYEEEVDGRIPFLDLLVIRNANNEVEFDVYRKETSTDRYITRNSQHPESHKMAAFHSMIHRLVNLPLSEEKFKLEEERIKNAAVTNGYSKEVITKMINKKLRRVERRRNTTLQSLETQRKIPIVVTYHPSVNNRLRNTLRSNGFSLINKPAIKLQQFLGSTKDKIENDQKSGIYTATCGDCDNKYIGQTARTVKTRFKEHLSKYFNRHYDQSAIAAHLNDTGHDIFKVDVKLSKHVLDRRKLDFWETLFIRDVDPDELMNREPGPLATSCLLKYV